MARPRIPSAKHQASGAFEHDPQREAARAGEPVPPGPLGDPPDYFQPDEKQIWRETASQAAEGVLTVSDRVLMEMYCLDIARLRRREYLKAAEKDMILRFLSRMGFTPADRSRVIVPAKPKKKPQNRFEAIAAAKSPPNVN